MELVRDWLPNSAMSFKRLCSQNMLYGQIRARHMTSACRQLCAFVGMYLNIGCMHSFGPQYRQGMGAGAVDMKAGLVLYRLKLDKYAKSWTMCGAYGYGVFADLATRRTLVCHFFMRQDCSLATRQCTTYSGYNTMQLQYDISIAAWQLMVNFYQCLTRLWSVNIECFCTNGFMAEDVFRLCSIFAILACWPEAGQTPALPSSLTQHSPEVVLMMQGFCGLYKASLVKILLQHVVVALTSDLALEDNVFVT